MLHNAAPYIMQWRPPVWFVGDGLAAAALSVGVHANAKVYDYTIFSAQNTADDASPSSTGLDSMVSTHNGTTAHARVVGGRRITGAADTHAFTKGAGTYTRLRANVFRNVETGIIDSEASSSNNTGTGFTIPAMTVNNPGSMMVCSCLVKSAPGSAVLPIDLTALPAGAAFCGNTNNSNFTCSYFYVPNLSAWSGYAVSWSGSAGYVWNAYIIR